MTRGMKKAIRPLGYLVTVVSVLYIVNIFLHFDWHALRFENPLLSIVYIVLFGVWASLFVAAGAFNWKLILEFLSGTRLPLRDVLSVYLRSNAAKYLPGNVMHYAGRNFLGSKLGWNNSEIAFSSLLELLFGVGLNGVVILLFVSAGLVTLPPQFPLKLQYEAVFRYAAVAAAGAMFSLLLLYAYRLVVHNESLQVTSEKLRARGKEFLSRRFVLLVGKMFLIALCCFVLNCAFYFYLCDLVLGFHLSPADFFAANTALAVAGYFGVLTPGAPGGLGVRESVSVLLLSAYGYPKEPLVLSIIVFRIACTLGDLIPYVAIKLAGRRSSEQTGSNI